MEIGIVGYGHVGKAMSKLFPNAAIYDEPNNLGTRELINKSDICFVCVPTPQKSTGQCDTSIVEKVLDWIDTPIIVLRSTVPVGFTKRMKMIHNKELVFQPEYYGETTAHPYANLKNQDWIILGGEEEAVNTVIEAYQEVVNSSVHFYITDENSAEFTKHMENSFLATKVIFCNEMYDIADKMGINYNVVRELWLADKRIGRSHTFVYRNKRGFGGKCLPKDLNSFIFQAKEHGIEPSFLESVKKKNDNYNE